MAKVRTFRWAGGVNGFDVVGDAVFRVRDGARVERSYSWTLEELEGYAKSTTDSLEETTPKQYAEVHTTRVLLVNGEVTSLEDAKALRDSLQQAIADYEGVNKEAKAVGVDRSTVMQKIDRSHRTGRQEPDFPGQILVQGTWTAEDEGDGWIRTSFGTPAGTHPDQRLHIKIEESTLRSVLERHGRNSNW